MADNTVKGSRKITSTGSTFNAISFLIDKKIGAINTAIPVRVVSVDAAAGTISALPLITQRDGFGNALAPSILPRLPYNRIQGGRAAVIIDPVPGDVGLAVFAQSDCSNVTREQSEPVTPGSFRSFDMADGFYISGFLNAEPEIYLEMTQDGAAKLHAPARVIVETGDITVQATGAVNVECESANVTASGAVEVSAGSASVKTTGAVDVQAATAQVKADTSLIVTAPTTEVTADTALNLNSSATISLTAPAIALNGVISATGAVTATDFLAQRPGATPVSLAGHQHGVVGNTTTPPI